ncbi:hypothetical protein ZOSMA_74G01250 [Zostera marina]|uniref:NPH3 domain-containing protein n=1 Tax=Zostera marina TaxID=29655 RepID=A0A0K9NS23_ZOSMR|nr:hypothetical protein ZOSMA_74G01250 [Zostera marina]
MISPRLSNPEKKVSLSASSRGSPASSQFTTETWIDDPCILDMDHFVKSLSGVKAKGIRPDLIGSIISHYATKWLPELSGKEPNVAKSKHGPSSSSPESSMAVWMKKKFFVETLVGILPPEKECLPCNFLLRLLRMASMVGADAAYLADLEGRVAWQLDQASLKEIMIPAFSHTCGTLLDVELVLRLVRRFVSLDDSVKSGAAIVKVAKLVDIYLAEAALDANMKLTEFEALAGVLPSHARATDDGLYRAVDTYLKVQEYKT